MNLAVATIRSSGHQAVALRAPRLPGVSYWVSKLGIGMPAAVLMVFFCSESNGDDGAEQRASGSCAARSQVTPEVQFAFFSHGRDTKFFASLRERVFLDSLAFLTMCRSL